MNPIDPCGKSNTPGLCTLQQALKIIFTSIKPLTGKQTVDLKDSLGRIIAENTQSPVDIPSYRNSAMDGYAFHSNDIPVSGDFTLRIVGKSWAGKPYNQSLSPGQCIRIFTGAAVPENADTVIMQENTSRNNDSIQISSTVKAGDNIRHPGKDIGKGQTILSLGKRLNAVDLGLLASIGMSAIPVIRKLRVAFFSTGDELRPLGQQLEFGAIYDSNRYILNGLLSQFGADVLDMGVIRDHPDAIKAALTEAAAISDTIITTGGASVGEADYLQQALKEVGTIKFWKIAIKPGKPLLFGEINGRHFFGLPGNPVSVAVTFYKIVLPALKVIMGETYRPPVRLKARCNSSINKIPGRQEFQRGILQQEGNGELVVNPFSHQESHILSSMSNANCFIVLPAETTNIKLGEHVDIELFESF